MKSEYQNIRAEWKAEKLAHITPVLVAVLVLAFLISGYNAF